MKHYVLLALALFTLQAAAQRGEGRIALVVGNGQYGPENTLATAANDAHLMATALEELGFVVIKHANASKAQLEDALNGFRRHLKYNTVALVYYSGHSIPYNGRNYWVPVDARMAQAADVPTQCVDMQSVLQMLGQQPEAINLMVLDVFRELPYASWASTGLADLDLPAGVLLAQASGNGQPSGESNEHYGLYTEHLAREIRVHQELSDLFANVRRAIAESGNTSQKPIERGVLNGKFYFKTSPLQSSQLANKAEVYLVPKADPPATLRVNCTLKGTFYLGSRPLGNFEPNSLYNLPNIAPGKYTLRLNKWSMDLIVEPGKTYEITVGEAAKAQQITAQVVDKTGVEMVPIQGGSYLMGSPEGDNDEKPQHSVTVSDFSLSRTEITNQQYCRFLNAIQSPATGVVKGISYIKMNDEDVGIEYINGQFVPKPDREHYPVVEVSWFGAEAYCSWADGRLPTEAEWEYAARGGKEADNFLFSGSNQINEVAWYVENSRIEGSGRDYDIHPVAQKAPNALGLYDMSGNVWEWCADWYAPYDTNPKTNPRGADTGRYRSLRGGSARFEITRCRVAYRYSRTPMYSNDDRGFRLARDGGQK